MDVEAAADAVHDHLMANEAEAQEIAQAEAELAKGISELPAAEWSNDAFVALYTRLLVEHRGVQFLEALRIVKGAQSYQQVLERLRQVREAAAAAAAAAGGMVQQASPALLKVIHSPELFSIILGFMTAPTLCKAEAVCRTWRRRVADNQEWERRVDLLPRGYHAAPAQLRQWGAWAGEHALTTIGSALSAKEVFKALSALNKPVTRPAFVPLTPADVAIAVSITMETPRTAGVPIERADPGTFRTAIACAQVLPVADAVPIGEVFADWAGGQVMNPPRPAGQMWPCEVDTREMLQLPPAAQLPADEDALFQAIGGVRSTAYAFDQSPHGAKFAGDTKGAGARSGAMAYISLRAVRRSDNKVVPLLDKAPVYLAYGGGGAEHEHCIEFGSQQIIQHYISMPHYNDTGFMIGPYDAASFPRGHDGLTVRAYIEPRPGTLQWQLGLEFFMNDDDTQDGQLSAPSADVLKLLSVADWR